MYPPIESPDVTYHSCPLDMKFYPDDAWAILPMANLTKPPAEVSDVRLFQVAGNESNHSFWRCCAVTELFFRQGVIRQTLLAFHQVFCNVSTAAQFRLLFDLNCCLQRGELDRGPIDDDVIRLYLDSLRSIRDYRLARPSWLLRAQFGDETVFDDVVETFERYKWGDPTPFLESLKAEDFGWTFVVERKPLSDETAVFHMPCISVESPIHMRHQSVQSGDWLMREITTIGEIENDECIIEIPAEKSGVLSKWIVHVGDIIEVGDPLCEYHPHID